jgi:two-component system, NarL family, sensor kinase
LKTTLLIFLLLITAKDCSSQSQRIDSLKRVLLKTKQDTTRVNLLNDIGGHLILNGAYKEARSYLHKSKLLAKKLNFKQGLAVSLNLQGTLLLRQTDYAGSLKCYKEALKIRQDLNDKHGIADIKSNIGIIHSERGEYEQALKTYFEARQTRESINDSGGCASSEINIGNIFFLQGNHDKALKYYSKSLITMKKLNRPYEVALLLNNIGLIYSVQHENAKSLTYFFECLKVVREIGDEEGEASALGLIGEAYSKQGKYPEALEYYKKSIPIFERLNNKRALAESYALSGVLSDSLNQYEKAIEYFTKQLLIATEIGSKKNIREANFNLSNHYKKVKDFKKAYQYYVAYITVKDSMFNETNTKLLNEIEAKYENEKKQRKIKLLLKENEIKQLAIDNGKNKLYASLLGIVLLIVMGFLLFQWNRQRNRKRMHDQILLQKELKTKAIIAAQEEEQVRIAKDLHDGVGQLLTGLKLGWEKIIGELKDSDQSVKTKIISSGTVLNEAAEEVRSISHQMMPRSLSESGLVVAIEDMLNTALKHSNIQYDFEHSNISERFSKEIEITLFRITQELINNILKHAEATVVTIQLFKTKEQLVLFVEDNGKGFKFDELKQKGLGLINIITRAKLIGGEVNYEPGPFKGTNTTIRIPIK